MDNGVTLSRKLSSCDDCPFGGAKVGSRGDPASLVAIVGESPGVQEFRRGIPFIGPSGEILWDCIPRYMHDNVYVTNALYCFPRKKDPSILARATKLCQERLLAEVGSHPRSVIIALGNAAMWSLTGDYNLKITQERGKIFSSDLASIGIIPVLHPAALMHGTGSFRQFKADLTYAFDLAAGAPRKKPIIPKFIVCDTVPKVREATGVLSGAEYLAADTETGGFDRINDEVLCLGISEDPSEVFIFPEVSLPFLRPLFHAQTPKWIWHNGKFDMHFIRRYGLDAKVDEDTMLLSYALDESGGVHDLEQVAGELLGAPNYKHMVKPYAPKKTDSYRNVPPPILHKYLSLDTSNTLQIFNILRPLVARDPHLEKLYTKVLIPASELLYHVEKKGIQVDPEQVLKNEKRLTGEIEETITKLHQVIGYEINPNSPKQVAKLLFDELGLRKLNKRSTAKEVLDRLPKRPEITGIRDFRKATKARSTYSKPYLPENGLITPGGRLYTHTYNIHGTRTGRLSSKEPNVQNIPRDPELRGIFIAAPGHVLIEFDYDQAELRSLAALSGDTRMVELYNDPTHMSIHDETGNWLFGENFSSEQRMRSKAVNFGIVYGREAQSLADEFGVSLQVAQSWIDGWFERFPGAHAYIKRCRRAPLNGETMYTSFGRKKRHWLVTKKMLKAMQNEASNFPHQSIASDLTLDSAIRVRERIAALGAYIVNLIHDSILVECPDIAEVIERVCDIVITAMEATAPM